MTLCSTQVSFWVVKHFIIFQGLLISKEGVNLLAWSCAVHKCSVFSVVNNYENFREFIEKEVGEDIFEKAYSYLKRESIFWRGHV